MKYKLQELFQKHHITGINFNSKKIKPGEAFFAIKGSNLDGNEYIPDVLKAGAKLVFTDNKLYEKETGFPIIYVEDARRALDLAASIFYPEIPPNLIAVTGTNGKTSVVAYCQQLFTLLVEDSACIGTIGVQCLKKEITKYFSGEQYNSLTTADITTFRYILNKLAGGGVNYVAFEASSHGIAQQRLGEIQVQTAAFTSFSLDHLEYHKTMDNYLQAKLKLFTNHLVNGGLVIINSEIPEISYINDFLKEREINYLTVGTSGDLKVKSSEQSILGQKITFNYLSNYYDFNTEIIGSFQASNLLIAAILVHQFGFSIEEIVKILPKVKAVRGRLERVTSLNDPYQVFVDYAHTPDALEKSLNELKKVKPPTGKLVIVFGCGGNRDIRKRPIMGKVASRLADIVIITDDNPRFEEAGEIRKQILPYVPEALEIGDRKAAIISAINMLKEDDILLITGKGHEDYQIIGDKKLPFDDIEIAQEALKVCK